MVGRHRGQAPEIDGVVFLSGGECRPGTFVDVRVTQATDYDLLGAVLETEDANGELEGSANAPVAPFSRPLMVKASDGRRVLRTL